MTEFLLPIIPPLVTIIVIALASALMGITVANAVVLERFRLWVSRRGQWPRMDELVRCSFCVTFWIVLFWYLLYRPELDLTDIPYIDHVLSYFFTMGLTQFFTQKLFP